MTLGAAAQAYQRPSPLRQEAATLSTLGSRFQDQNLTPLTAVVRGLLQGTAASKNDAATKEEEERGAKWQQMIEAQEQQARYLDEVKLSAERFKLSSMERAERQESIDEALSLAENMGDPTGINKVLDGMPATKELVASELPEGAALTGVAVVNGHLLAVGTMPDGKQVFGSEGLPVGRMYSPTRQAENLRLQGAAQINQAREQKMAGPAASGAPGAAETPPPLADRPAGETAQLLPPPVDGNTGPGLPSDDEIAQGVPLSAEQKRGVDARKAVRSKQKGSADVARVLNDIEGHYGKLNKAGAIVDPAATSVDNALASVASSAPGQIAGNFVGTENQATRQAIKNSLPLLMAAIKNATGMSAQQMNSNAELQFYMQAATDPSKDIQSNVNAINTLREMFGEASDKPANAESGTAKTVDRHEGKTATNPKTGQKIMRKGGQWVLVQ